MRCANPQCSKELVYLREGKLELLELESHSHDQVTADEKVPGKVLTQQVLLALRWQSAELCGSDSFTQRRNARKTLRLHAPSLRVGDPLKMIRSRLNLSLPGRPAPQSDFQPGQRAVQRRAH